MSFSKKDQDTATLQEIEVMPSTIETIDQSVFYWVDEELDLSTETNEGFKKTPVIWVGSDRAFQIKHKKEMRDDNSSLVFPIITIERTGLTKDLTWKGTAWGNIPYGSYITVARRINQKKTSNFANAYAKRKKNAINFPMKNERIVYETISVPMPVYVRAKYKISLFTEYVQQMNTLVTPFISRPTGINYVIIDSKEGHKYEAFLGEDFTLDSNVSSLGEEDRKIRVDIDFEVLGYLQGDEKNQQGKKILKREGFVEVKFNRERTIFADINEFGDDTKYRG